MSNANTQALTTLEVLYKYWRIVGTGFSFAVFGLGAFFIALALLLLLYPFPVKRDIKQRCTRYIVWRATWVYVRMMWLLGLLSFEFENIDSLRKGGQLVIANHPSLLDVVFLMSVMPNTNCIVKAAMLKNPFTFGVVSLAGYIPNNNNGEELINKAAETLQNGQTLIIFPEGTRTEDETALSFKRGAANIALKAQCQIRPVVIECNPMTLRKHEQWYQVPNTPPHFKLSAFDALTINACIDTSRTNAVQARHLTRFLQNEYENHLSLTPHIAQQKA